MHTSPASQFTIELRLDTPLLLGGPERGQPDPDHFLSCKAVRGLLHTFARALLGPLLGSDASLTRMYEHRLLGEPGDTSGRGATYRVQDVISEPLNLSEKPFLLLPHKNQGQRNGYDIDQIRSLRFLPRPHLSKNREFIDALAALAWTAFSLGSLGARSRRGYGSLTVTAISHSLNLPDNPPLPVFEELPASATDLLTTLEQGLRSTQSALKNWIKAEVEIQRETLKKSKLSDAERRQREQELDGALSRVNSGPVPLNGPHRWFQIAQRNQIMVGPPHLRKGYEPLMVVLMNAASSALSQHRVDFRKFVGSPSRLASPLWVRFYRGAGDQWFPLVTWSPRSNAVAPIKIILDEIGVNGDGLCAAVSNFSSTRQHQSGKKGHRGGKNPGKPPRKK